MTDTLTALRDLAIELGACPTCLPGGRVARADCPDCEGSGRRRKAPPPWTAAEERRLLARAGMRLPARTAAIRLAGEFPGRSVKGLTWKITMLRQRERFDRSTADAVRPPDETRIAARFAGTRFDGQPVVMGRGR